MRELGMVKRLDGNEYMVEGITGEQAKYILEGAGEVNKLVEYCVKNKFNITDVMKLLDACKGVGLKPIDFVNKYNKVGVRRRKYEHIFEIKDKNEAIERINYLYKCGNICKETKRVYIRIVKRK